MDLGLSNTKSLSSGNKRTILYHVLFWISLILLLAFVDSNSMNFKQKLMLETVNIFFYALIVYINYLYIFPAYLKSKNFFKHLLWLISASLIIAPIKSLLLYLTTTNPNIQGFFLDNQYFIFLSTLFVGFSASIYFVMTDWIKTQREKQELERETLQSELKFLKSQINPHFLFNTLNSLYALTLKKSDEAPEIVLKLSEMMRYMLYDCNEKQVPLEKEVSYIRNYLGLEKLRHGKKMDINLEVHGEIRHQQIAPLLFIPFIENCFKHGIRNRIENGFVNIVLDIHPHELSIKVENSKSPSMPNTTGKRSGGIGLINVKRRLDLLYPNKYKLDVETSPTVYKVNLTLKLISQL
jgi:LytS/YehU family sensor histidine kinase